MPEEENTRKEALGTGDDAAVTGGFVTPPPWDPGSEPTISSERVDAVFTEPTRVDPAAPIHRGMTPADSARPTTRNHVALPVGYRLQEYTIEALLGTGGFGLTYLARDNNLQCQVAIKEYLPNDLAVRSAGQTVCARTESDTHGYRIGLESFLAESRVLASFRHPNIVRVTRFFEANNTAYMVMEYERGEPLRDWIKRHGPLAETQLLKMFLPLLEGLDVVHRARVLHRDIKPANIYVREEDGSLVLLDFGAARYAGSGDSRSLTSIVTPGYAPFEQYHTHGAQGPWTDLYALGGVLYWVVTGEKPLEAPSRVRNDTMPPASVLARGRYSARLLRAIDWALTPDETERPKAVSQLKAVLTGEAEPPPARQPAQDVPPAKPPGRLSRLAGAAAAVMLLAIAALLLYPRPQPPAPVTETPPAAAKEVAPPPTVTEEAAPPPAPAKKENAQPRAAAKKEAPPQAVGKKPPEATKTAGETARDATAESVAAPPPGDRPKEKPAAPPTATVILNVRPQGEIVVDGRPAGLSPPLSRLTLSAGTKHRIEIHGAGPSHYWTVELQPGEKREIRADFERRDF